jgi:hypothetical protein
MGRFGGGVAERVAMGIGWRGVATVHLVDCRLAALLIGLLMDRDQGSLELPRRY